MHFLFPAGAWGFLSLGVITALYLLKRRSQTVQVPSLLLWQRAAAEQQVLLHLFLTYSTVSSRH